VSGPAPGTVVRAVDVRSTPEGLTPAWLTEALRGSGAIGRASVTDVSFEPCGTGQLGDCFRLALTYDRAEDGAPATLVAKLPSTDPVSRGYAAAVGLYAKEVRFYQEVASRLAIRTPRAHVAAIAGDAVDFVLLFEDLAPAVSCDQLVGCDPDQAALVMDQAAAMHASSWGPARLEGLGWMRQEGSWAALAEHMPALHDAFRERYGDVLEREHLEVAARLREGIAGWARTLDEQRCIWHMDFRLDNMLFGAKGGEVPLAVVDWQSVSLGPGISDVSYFIGAGLPVAERRRHEEDLVRHYHAALCAAGVDDYDWDRCWRDYRTHAVLGFFTAINASVNVKRTLRGDEMFMTMARRHGDQILANGTLELIGA
jgi:hypothetical protein